MIPSQLYKLQQFLENRYTVTYQHMRLCHIIVINLDCVELHFDNNMIQYDCDKLKYDDFQVYDNPRIKNWVNYELPEKPKIDIYQLFDVIDDEYMIEFARDIMKLFIVDDDGVVNLEIEHDSDTLGYAMNEIVKTIPNEFMEKLKK